jgi:glycerophosphoryl diester phosphodiesterase
MSRPLIVAHRGASAVAPENTMAAFRAGLDAGAEGVEFDVRLTKDDVPVVFHDATMQRVAGIDARLGDLTFDELADVDVGSWFSDPKRRAGAGRSPAAQPDRDRFAGQRISSLDEVLELFADAGGPVYVELKCDRPSDAAPLVAAACRAIKASPVPLSRVIVKSFELRALPIVGEDLPDVGRAALFAPKVGRLLRPSMVVETALRHEATHLSLHRSLVGPRVLKHADAVGLPVTAWTVDSSAWLARRMNAGLFAVITNDPARLLAAL